MKNKLPKSISLLLSLTILCLSVFIAPITEAKSYMTLSELKEKFPHNMYWNHIGSPFNNPDGYTSTPCPNHWGCDYYGNCGCNSFGNSIQCYGFANKLAYDAFRSYYPSWPKTSLANVKPGDVIRYRYNGHSIFVTGVDGDVITYGDCNSDCRCVIKWDSTITKSEIAASLTAVYSSPSTLTVDEYIGTDENTHNGSDGMLLFGTNKVVKTGWQIENNKWYFLDQNGKKMTGWILDNGMWYFLDQSGVMVTGWLFDNGAWYFLDSSGAMVSGWLFDNGVWYLLDSSGAMMTGWVEYEGSKYYFDESGEMVTGWVEYDG
ncbi:MAG: hypothetical protein Q4B14_07200, partial [Clostridia bacterium]|nr:hypothetical protein [Clostridia bacterium]